MTKEERREALKDICQIVKVEGIDSFKRLSALDNEDFSDFEDCLQEERDLAQRISLHQEFPQFFQMNF